MRRLGLAIVLAAGASWAGPAAAAITLNFEALTVFRHPDMTAQFTYTTTSLPVGGTVFVPAEDLSTCSVTATLAHSCQLAVFRAGNFSNIDRVELAVRPLDPGAAGYLSMTIGYRFAHGALNTPGVYDSLDPTTQMARLTVSGFVEPYVPPSVPEPATWALLVGGFGMVGVSLRRRHGRPVAG